MWLSMKKYSFLAISAVFFITIHAAQEEVFGKKHDNLVKLKSLCAHTPQVAVPEFFGISSQRVEEFLSSYDPKIFIAYNTLLDHIALLSFEELKQQLGSLQAQIRAAFHDQLFTFTQSEKAFFAQLRSKSEFLMVRSTGIEDGHNAANAGGNASIAYVTPVQQSVTHAMGEVVASYFGAQSIKNRIASGEDLQKTALCLPVLIQRLIGETAQSIPVSGVAYSTHAALSNHDLRITEINAAYGHGEGVVANRVACDRYYLIPSLLSNKPTIYPQIRIKKDRLKKEGVHELISQSNNPELHVKPALNDDVLCALFDVLKQIEGAYGYSVDVEFVVKDGIIYLVQVRPAMQPVQDPSYFFDQPSKAIIKRFHAHGIVPGASQAHILALEDVLITHTLDQADQHSQSVTAQAVVVQEYASSLSHAAVNFMSHNTPCFYLQDFEAFTQLCDQWKSTYRLIIDAQQSQILIWDAACESPKNFLMQGWARHPMPAAFSSAPEVSLQIQAVLPQDVRVKKLLHALGQQPSNKRLVEELDALVQRTFKLTRKRINFLSQKLTLPVPQALVTALEARWNQSILEYQAALSYNKSNYYLLALQAVLRSMLEPDAVPQLCGNYHYRSGLLALLDVQKTYIYQHKQKAGLLAEEAAYASYAFEMSDEWINFLHALDREYALNKDEGLFQDIQLFKKILSTIKENGYLELWFATEFYTSCKQHTTSIEQLRSLIVQPENLIGRLLAMVGKTPIKFLKELNKLQDIKNQLTKFEQFTVVSDDQMIALWHQYEQQVLSRLAFCIELYKKGTSFEKLICCDVLCKVVDTTDHMIKRMKISDLSFEEKKNCFKKMLESFKALSELIIVNIMPEDALAYHEDWPLLTYSNVINIQWHNLDWQNCSETIFKKSEQFSVNAAVVGAGTKFDRHYPAVAEDYFMLFHQNALAALAGASKAALGSNVQEKIKLPAQLEHIMTHIESDDQAALFRAYSCSVPARIGISFAADDITVIYNMSLRNHSSRILVTYKKHTKECLIEVQLVGESRNRWKQVLLLGHLSSDLCGLPLEHSSFDKLGGCVTVQWKVESASLPTLLQVIALMGNMSFGHDLQVSSLLQLNQQLSPLQLRAILEKYLNNIYYSDVVGALCFNITQELV